MTDENDCYVLVTIEGPFGPVQQVSALMRPSEAAMSAASIKQQWASRGVSRVELVQLRKEV